VSHIKFIPDDQISGSLERQYAAARDRAGDVANIIRVMNLDPLTCQTSIQFYGSLMKRDNALKAAQREMLATVVSNINGCYY